MSRRGSTLVESAIVLTLFLVLLIGVMDFAQILFFHEFLVERARSGARYATVHAYDPAAIRTFVAYNTTAPAAGSSGLFGLKPEMVQVNHYDSGSTGDRVEVQISGFKMRFLSPWLSGIFTPGPFRASMPLESAGVVD